MGRKTGSDTLKAISKKNLYFIVQVLFILLFFQQARAQEYGNEWIIGTPNVLVTFDTTHHFNYFDTTAALNSCDVYLDKESDCICSASGEMQFYYNGMNILSYKKFGIMDNGDSLDCCLNQETFVCGSYAMNASIIIPFKLDSIPLYWMSGGVMIQNTDSETGLVGNKLWVLDVLSRIDYTNGNVQAFMAYNECTCGCYADTTLPDSNVLSGTHCWIDGMPTSNFNRAGGCGGCTNYNGHNVCTGNCIATVTPTDTVNNNCSSFLDNFSERQEAAAGTNSNGFNLHIYPNPSDNLVTIDLPAFSSLAQLSVTSLEGKILFTTSISRKSNNYKLNTLEFEDGVYILKLSQNNKSIGVAKAIIQH